VAAACRIAPSASSRLSRPSASAASGSSRQLRVLLERRRQQRERLVRSAAVERDARRGGRQRRVVLREREPCAQDLFRARVVALGAP
jgi:hypothetical protein